jgi:hypothetical protein
VIARVLRELTLMEKWGSGYLRIREDCAVLGHLLPDELALALQGDHADPGDGAGQRRDYTGGRLNTALTDPSAR